jgi:diguanylate cyclase (GGDEF)-like protein
MKPIDQAEMAAGEINKPTILLIETDQKDGRLLTGCILDEDLATYFGYEKFALALPYLEKNNAVNIANRIHKAIVEHHLFPQESPISATVTVSIGIAFCPDDACTAEQLIQRADAALGNAKRQGKDRICQWEDSSTTEN